MVGYENVDNFPNVDILENAVVEKVMDGRFRSSMVGDITMRLDELSVIELLIFNDIFYSWLDGGSTQYIGRMLDDFLQKFYEDKAGSSK